MKTLKRLLFDLLGIIAILQVTDAQSKWGLGIKRGLNGNTGISLLLKTNRFWACMVVSMVITLLLTFWLFSWNYLSPRKEKNGG